MSNNQWKSLSPEMKINEKSDKIRWEGFKIDFRQEAQEFPDNKIYVTIRIDPDIDRQLIENFTIIINNHNHGEIAADCRNISIAGFDINSKRQSNVRMKIRANPINRNLKAIKKESETCVCSFTKEIISFSPIIKFDWTNEHFDPVAVIKWYLIDDPSIRTYDITIDGDIIKHVKQKTSKEPMETLIYGITPGQQYTFQILAKLRNGKVKYKSDLIEFIVPLEKDVEDGEKNIEEVLHIQREKIPENIRDFTIIEQDKTQCEENVLDLLGKLRQQIEQRRKKLKQK